MKKLLLLFAFALSAVPADAEDLTPVKTRPITRLQPEKATCVLRSPYFASILNRKTTVRFVMNVAWFVYNEDDLMVDWSSNATCSDCFGFRYLNVVTPSIKKVNLFHAHATKHNDFQFKRDIHHVNHFEQLQQKVHASFGSGGSCIYWDTIYVAGTYINGEKISQSVNPFFEIE